MRIFTTEFELGFDHLTCESIHHEYTADSEVSDLDYQMQKVTRIGSLLLCDHCGHRVFYCTNIEQFFHAAPYLPCFSNNDPIDGVTAAMNDETDPSLFEELYELADGRKVYMHPDGSTSITDAPVQTQNEVSKTYSACSSCGHSGVYHSHHRPGTDCSVCDCQRLTKKPPRWAEALVKVWVHTAAVSQRRRAKRRDQR